MCGISVILSKKDIDENVYLKSLKIINHRGPDSSDQKIVRKDNYNLALGHNRLSIIDLSESGNQPMSYSNGRYTIVFNGEIYNYLELRNILLSYGYQFKSTSDTEVLLACFQQWSENMLNKLNGMFAFCIFDKEDDTLFIARDRFGIKPLYYKYKENYELKIASEIKQLIINEKPKVNWGIASSFIAHREFEYNNETFIDGVYKVLPGECINVNLQEVKMVKKPWYSGLSNNINYSNYEFSDVVNDFSEIFNDSVRLRLRSDVEVGSCLSGGLDSSSIVCTVNNILKESNRGHIQSTFSSCFNDKKYDEREYIEAVTSHTNTTSHYTFPNLKDFWKKMDQIIWHQDEPIWSTSLFAQWHVFELAAKNNVKVMLDGQGADEILVGYTNMFTSAAVKGLITGSILNRIKYSPYQIKTSLSQLRHKKSYNWLEKEYKGILKEKFNPQQCNSVRELSKELILRYHLPALLHYEDRNSMAHSVESRVPFLDHRLVEYAINLPDNYKYSKESSKRILRESMKGIIPNKVYNRKDKMGFVTPQQNWMFGEHKNDFRDHLKETVSLKPFNSEKIIQWFDDMSDGRVPFDNTIWRIISFGKWHKIFNLETDI